MKNYVVESLELHLFFSRIMKEHSFFLEAGFLPRDEEFIKEADYFKMQFENLLYDVVKMSNGVVRPAVLDSGEIVTEYTGSVEDKTQFLTGIPIDTEITELEEELKSSNNGVSSKGMEEDIKIINNAAIKLLNGLIGFKEDVLNNVLTCKMFTGNYPHLITHIIQEAKLYLASVMALENGQSIENQDMKQMELFWNHIMMDHALFIRGLLDPTESELINSANEFAKSFSELFKEATDMTDETLKSITDETIKKTTELRDFKEAGTKGINGCEIKSIILPLLADHVLREANHYLRLLKS